VRCDGSLTGRVGDLGLGFLNPPGEVVVLSFDDEAAAAGFEAAGFLASRTGALALAAALAVGAIEVVVAVEDLRDVRLGLGAGAFTAGLG